MFKEDERSQRIEKVEGVGPVVATAIVAVGNGTAWTARQMSAWLAMVPGQHSTGGRERLLGTGRPVYPNPVDERFPR
ncbi:MAG: transposase [bacterium]